MYDLTDKTIVISGGAGLLGQNFAMHLANFGSNIILLDINEPPAEIINEKSESKIFFLKEDITQKTSWENVKCFLNDQKFNCDVLINNACVKSKNFFAPFEEFPLSDWEQVMSVNVTAAMLGCQSLGSEMAKQKKGSIINIASIYGVVAPDQSIYEGSEYLGQAINTPAVYSASKASLLGLTRYLATYWGKQNVRVNAVTPGGVYSGQNSTFVAKYTAKVPLQRMATPKDICGAVHYLASDASNYITGQNIVVDGGWTAW